MLQHRLFARFTSTGVALLAVIATVAVVHEMS